MANNDDDGNEGDDGDEDDTDDDGARNSLRPKYKGSSCMRTSVGTDTHMHTHTHTRRMCLVAKTYTQALRYAFEHNCNHVYTASICKVHIHTRNVRQTRMHARASR